MTFSSNNLSKACAPYAANYAPSSGPLVVMMDGNDITICQKLVPLMQQIMLILCLEK